MTLKLKYAAVSDVGMIRKNNEDNVFMPGKPVREPKNNIYKNSGELSCDKTFFCVCDGMGGHSAGEVASYIAVSHVSQNYDKIVELVKKRSMVKGVFRDFVANTNDVIYDAAVKNPDFSSMGTTMTGICFVGGSAHFVNIGDSRVYMLDNTKLTQLSVDHTDKENTHALTRFLGMSSQYGRVIPDVSSNGKKIGLGKRFLLCSDGLTDMLDNAMITNVLIEKKEPEEAAATLVEEAKKNGGRDNVTVLVIDAKPSNSALAVITSKYAVIALCVLLIAGAIGAYSYKTMPKGGGSSLSDISDGIENAENIMEMKSKFDKFFKEVTSNIKYYDSFTNTVDETDDTVKSKNAELKTAFNVLRENNDKLKGVYDTLKNDKSLSDEDLFSKLKELQDTEEYKNIEKALAECKNKSSEVTTASEAFKKAREEEKKRQEEQQRQEKNSSGSSGNSSSGGSSSGEAPSRNIGDSGRSSTNDSSSGNAYLGGSSSDDSYSEDSGSSSYEEPSSGGGSESSVQSDTSSDAGVSSGDDFGGE